MKITAWSFSRYNTYIQCPLRAKLLYIDKRKEPGSPAMDRGNDIHKLAEGYVKGQVARIPKELVLFREKFQAWRKAFKTDRASIVVEDTWAFRSDWTRTTWDDWTGAWLRVKLDLAHVTPDGVTIVDHKTGKFSPQYNLTQYEEQVELYALASLIIYPTLTATPYLHFLDHEITHPGTPKVYAPSDLPALKKTWTKRTRAMLSDQRFAPRPSNMCRFCSFRKDAGGPCAY